MAARQTAATRPSAKPGRRRADDVVGENAAVRAKEWVMRGRPWAVQSACEGAGQVRSQMPCHRGTIPPRGHPTGRTRGPRMKTLLLAWLFAVGALIALLARSTGWRLPDRYDP